MSTKSHRNIIIKSILGLFMVIFIIAVCPIELQNDTFFDISFGKNYIENGMQTYDNFSVHKDLNFQTHHFLVNILIYKIYSLFNFAGLHVLEVFLTCIIALLFYLLNNNFIKDKKISYVLVFTQIIMFSAFISLRAQMFSTIIFLIEFLLINKYLYKDLSSKKSKLILLVLTLMPALLVNLHSGVIFFYYIILGVYIFNFNKINILRIENDKELKKDRLIKLLICSVISIPLLLLNPYGFSGTTYMFKTLSNSFINSYIVEFQPFNIKNIMGIYMVIYFFIHIFALMFSDKKIKIHEILFLTGTMFMSLLSIRHFIFYVISTVVLLPHLDVIISKTKKWLYNGLNENGNKVMTLTAYVLICFTAVTVIISSVAYKKYSFIPNSKYPVQAIEYIKNNIGHDKVIFNEYTWGSYMMLNNIKVFVDSRCDLYTKEYNKGVTVAEDYIKTIKCKIHYEDTVAKYNIQYFLLPKDEPLTVMLLKDNNYENIYKDDTSYIFKKR